MKELMKKDELTKVNETTKEPMEETMKKDKMTKVYKTTKEIVRMFKNSIRIQIFITNNDEYTG